MRRTATSSIEACGIRRGGRPPAGRFVVVGLVLAGGAIASMTGHAAEPPAPSATASLAAREQDLLRQYTELEFAFLRLADLLDATDPRRAKLLRKACESARNEQVAERLSTIVGLLEQGQLLKAGTTQQDAIGQLQALHDLLASGDDSGRLADTAKQVRQFLARISKTIARQRDISGSTESGAKAEELAERQEALAEESEGLAEDLGRFAERIAVAGRPADGEKPPGTPTPGKPTPGTPTPGERPSADDPGKAKPAEPRPGGSQPQEPADTPAGPADEGPGAEERAQQGGSEPQGDDESSRAARTARRLQAAERRMRAAQKQLEAARREESRQEQERAIEELETARAELEEILRQTREEEVERLLVQLEARIRDMLRAQRGVLTATEQLATAGATTPVRERELAAARLSREQNDIGAAAMKSLALVREDGTAAAIPQALEQVRDDAQQAAGRLARGDVGGTTQGILQDLVTSLEELLAALEKAQRDRESRERQARAVGGQPAQAGEQPLVDALAELKMIRSLQLRVNTRTKRFSALLGDGIEQADEPELRAALERLAVRQRLIERAAHDIVSGRTE